MSMTIDHAGRVVISKAIREQLHLVSGSRLEIDTSGNEIRLRVTDLEPGLIEKRGLLIHHGNQPSDVDITEFLRHERDARSSSMNDPFPQ